MQNFIVKTLKMWPQNTETRTAAPLLMLFAFILQSPDEQIHHFRKETDICKKL